MTAALAQPPQPPLDVFNVQKFEQDCADYKSKRKAEADAKTEADTIKARIMAEVKRFGLVPDNAPKSRRVSTRNFVCTLTTGTSVEVDDTSACELELLLSQARRSAKFPLLFSRRSEYSLEKGAAEVIEQERWPKKHAEQIRILFAKCFRPKTGTPSLSVETSEAVAERERKAAAKAAKSKKVAR